MSDLKIQGEVSLSTGEAEAALGRVGNKAGQMAVNMAEAGEKAGKAVDQIGDLAKSTGEKFTKAEASIVANLKRIAIEAARGKDVAEKLANVDFSVGMKGLDPAKFKPMVAVINELTAAQQRLDNVTGKAGRGFSPALQNTSYQLQDFIVQVNGGIDATMALSMQLPQLLGSFGAAGAAIGVVAAILPNLVSAFSESAAGAKDFKSAMSEFDKAIGNVGQTTKTFDMEGLYEEFNKSSKAVQAATIEQLKFQQEFIRTTQLVAGKKFGESLSGIGEYGFLDKMAGAYGADGAERLAKQLGLTVDVARDLLPVIKGLKAGTEDANNAFTNFGTKLLSGNAKAVDLATTMSELAKTDRDSAAASTSVSEALEKMASGHVRTKKEADAAAKAQKGLTKETEALQALLDTINGKSAQFDANYVQNVEMLLLAYDRGTLSLSQYNDVFARYVAMQPGAVAAAKELAKAEEDYAKAVAAVVDPLLRQAESLEQQVEFYGLSEQAIQSIIIARKEEALELARSQEGMESLVDSLEKEIEARKRIAAAAGQKSVLDANKAAAEKAAQDWQRVADDVGRGLTDAIFSGGKSGWDLLKKTIEATVIRAWVQPAITGAVGQAMGIPSATTMPTYGAAGSQGGAGAISSGYSLYNTISNGNSAVYAGFNNFATSSLGQSIGLSQAASADFMGPSISYQGGVGYNLSSTGSALSQALPYLPAITSLASGNYAGAIGSAIGGSVGGPFGAVIGNVLGSAVGGLFGEGGGPKTGGYAYGVIKGGNLKTGTTADWAGLTGSQTGAVEGLMKPVASSISKYIESLGGSAEGMRLRLGFNSDPQGTAPDWVYSEIKNAQGKSIYGNTHSVERGGAGKELTVELQRMALASVKAAEGLNPVFKEMLDGFNIAKASVKSLTEKAEELQKLKNVVDSLELINVASTALSKSSIAAAGGIDALSGKINAYYDTYFTAAEKEINTRDALQKQVTEVFSDMGKAVPASAKEFRTLVESLDTTTDAGKAAFASLMSVNGAFNAMEAYAAKADAITASFQTLGLGAVSLTDNLLKAAGGMDAMAANLAGFYQNYYSPDEKQAATESSLQAIFDKMGLIMPGTTDGFRAMVQAVDTSSPFGEKMLADLLSIQDQFYQYASAKQSAAETAATEALNASRDQVSAAYEKEAAALGDVISQMGDFEKAIGDFRKSLRLDATLSSYSPDARLALARSEFTDTSRRAALGDTQALGTVTEKAQTYLALAKDQLNTDEYARAFAAVDEQLQTAERVARAQKSIAEDSLDQLRQQVSGILTVDSSVRSVSQTIATYMQQQIQATRDGTSTLSAVLSSIAAANQSNAAIAAAQAAATAAPPAAAAPAATPATASPAAPVPATAKDAAAAKLQAYYKQLQQDGWGLLDDFKLNQYARTLGISATRAAAAGVKDYEYWLMAGLPSYATGGDHLGGLRLVGEKGPEIEATGPARIFNFEQTKALLSGGGNEELLDELRSLRQEVANLKAAQEATARNTAATRRMQERWDGDGMPETRATA